MSRLGERWSHFVVGMIIVGKTVQQNDRKPLRVAGLVISDVEKRGLDRFHILRLGLSLTKRERR